MFLGGFLGADSEYPSIVSTKSTQFVGTHFANVWQNGHFLCGLEATGRQGRCFCKCMVKWPFFVRVGGNREVGQVANVVQGGHAVFL